MNEKLNKKLSSRNRARRIFQNTLMVLTILLLAGAVVIAAMVLTGCSKEPESYPEAEAIVASELDEIKNSGVSADVLDSLKQKIDVDDEGLTEAYLNKVKDFDYEILGSGKADGYDNDAAKVGVRIKTYDFGNTYLKAWNEYLESEEYLGSDTQLYLNLAMRFTSLSSKDYTSDADVICVDADGSGNWKSDIKTNEELMNAISGGMLKEIQNLADSDENKGDSEDSQE